MGQLVKVTVAAAVSSYDRESCWAEEVDVAAGWYRIDNVLFFTDGVGYGDVVRCEPNAWGQLIAVEVVERSPYTTLVFLRCDDAPFASDEERDGALRELAEAVEDRLGEAARSERGSGMLAVCADADRVDDLLACIAATSGEPRDDARRHAGEWVWDVASSPDVETPLSLPGSAELLAEPGPDLVAVDWPQPDDALAAGWPDELVGDVREAAMIDPRVRDALDERRYLPVVAMLVRQVLTVEHGPAKVGPPPVRLFPAADAAERARDRDAWRDRQRDGRTRWATDDDVDAEVRRVLERLGLDPDADPYAPAG